MPFVYCWSTGDSIRTSVSTVTGNHHCVGIFPYGNMLEYSGNINWIQYIIQFTLISLYFMPTSGAIKYIPHPSFISASYYLLQKWHQQKNLSLKLLLILLNEILNSYHNSLANKTLQ